LTAITSTIRINLLSRRTQKRFYLEVRPIILQTTKKFVFDDRGRFF